MSDLMNRNLARGLKPGANVLWLDGNKLHYDDGTWVDLGQINNDPMWCEHNPVMFKLLNDLSKELRIFQKIVKEFARREGTRITDPNEFHRGLTSLANKIREEPGDLREVFEPILRDLFEKMLSPVGQKSSSKKRRGKGGRHV